jgi:serine/threonine protein kinase
VAPVGEDDTATRVLDPLVLRARSRIGTTLRDKWHLDALLGVGGMASVYAATHRNGSRAAVKVLHPEQCLNPEMRARFVREGHVANAVGHEGAVRVIDDDVADDGSLFLVTELLDGETLEERRVRLGDRLPEDEVLSATDQLLDVLAAAHANGIVHRDLKPDNVFLTQTGQIKVLDFGIARLRELSTAGTATQEGATMGTPAFMAPEQARGLWDEVDARSDLWAVGATMFLLLSGRFVHEGRSNHQTLYSAMTQPAPALATVLEGVSPAVAHVVDRALAFEKEHRWLDARRMQEAVRVALQEKSGTTVDAAAPPVSNRALPGETTEVTSRFSNARPPLAEGAASAKGRGRGRRMALALGGAVALGLAAALVLSAKHDAPEPFHGPRTPLAAATDAEASGSAPVEAPPPTAVGTSSEAPEIAATDLPETARPPPAKSPPVRKGAPAKSCNPPYTMDPGTGVKTYKRECR